MKESLTLRDQLDEDVLRQLNRAKKRAIIATEEREQREKEARRREREEREKNKTFEQLLDEYSGPMNKYE